MIEAARVTIPVETNAATAAASMSKLKTSLTGATTATSKYGTAASATSAQTTKLSGAFSGLGKILGAGALYLAFKKIISATAEAQKAEAQLNAVIKSTGGVAGVTAEEMKKLATALQNTTLFEDDAIIAAESLLLTFTKVGGEVIPRATSAILDMSQAMGQDLKSSTIQVGKALNDPIAGISALSRVGVQLTEDQKDLIKSFVAVGDVASAQNVILGELETQFGGAAEAATRTLGGALTQLSNSAGNALEIIGEGLSPGLSDLAIAMRIALEEGGVFIEGLKLIGEALGFLAKGLANIVDMFNFANKQMKLKDAQKETADLIDGMEGVREQAKLSLGVVGATQGEVLKKLREIIKTETDPRRVKVAQSIIDRYKGQSVMIQQSIEKQTDLIADQEEIANRVNGNYDETTKKMSALLGATKKVTDKTDDLSNSAEEYAKTVSEARGILANAGDSGAFLEQQRAAFTQQIETVQAAGLDVATLEKFQQSQRLSQLNDFFKQSAGDESKSFAERQQIIAEQNAIIQDNESITYEEKLAAQQAFNTQSQELERQRLVSFAAGVALYGGALTDIGAIAGSISQVQQNNMQAEIEAMERKGASAEAIEAKRAQLARKAAQDQKKLSLFSIAINTAVSVSKTLAEYGFSPLGVGLAALATAKGLAESAAVASTPIPAAQFGGSFVVPPGNEADSGLLKVNSGERVDVTPTRQSDSGGSKNVILMVEGQQMKAYLVNTMNEILNSGAVNIHRKGVVKTA